MEKNFFESPSVNKAESTQDERDAGKENKKKEEKNFILIFCRICLKRKNFCVFRPEFSM